MAKVKVEFTVNNRKVEVEVDPTERLLDTLRDRLNLTGVKEGCAVGECGACTVLFDGEAMNSCLIPTVQAEGKEVLTIEGLGTDDALDPLQQSFIDYQAVQCGFCTPGMILSAKALLNKNSSPTREDIKHAIDGNLCRCTGYEQIIQAVQDAADGEVEA
ncbi:MAG: (2Fe-2S)-binding protein [Bacillota bacterium]